MALFLFDIALPHAGSFLSCLLQLNILRVDYSHYISCHIYINLYNSTPHLFHFAIKIIDVVTTKITTHNGHFLFPSYLNSLKNIKNVTFLITSFFIKLILPFASWPQPPSYPPISLFSASESLFQANFYPLLIFNI